ncbi:MAG: hypothetical protein F6J86_26870, partial [Symploca sp. SIO1B1]|nr:hypothetical protein [Symploca sp. SIO1B1]
MINGIGALVKELVEAFNDLDKKSATGLLIIVLLAYVTSRCGSPPTPVEPAIGGGSPEIREELQEIDEVDSQEFQTMTPDKTLEETAIDLIQDIIKERAVVIFKVAHDRGEGDPE